MPHANQEGTTASRLGPTSPYLLTGSPLPEPGAGERKEGETEDRAEHFGPPEGFYGGVLWTLEEKTLLGPGPCPPSGSCPQGIWPLSPSPQSPLAGQVGGPCACWPGM